MAFVLEPSRPLAAWLDEVRGWLDRSPGFFAGKPVLLNVRDVVETRAELAELVGALTTLQIRVMGLEGANETMLDDTLPPAIAGGRGATMIEVLPEAAAATQAATAPAKARETKPATAAKPVAKAADKGGDKAAEKAGDKVADAKVMGGLIIDHAIRSGQTISHPGDVTIVGSVASGAEIVAGGSIHVYGVLRGRAVAGVSGDERARIFAQRFAAELIAIGGHYRTAEDLGPAPVGRTVQALIMGGELKTDIFE
jgi:septum site-determining protein MinC